MIFHNRVRLLVSLLILCAMLIPLSHSWAEEHDHAEHTAETIWTCSMHPQIQLPEFGQCPICFMDLIEVPKDDGAANRTNLRQISFDERARRLAQVEVVPVIRSSGMAETRMMGKVDYDETRLGTITAWVSGRLDTLHVDYTGALVSKGQAMAEIYSPELISAQAELLQASSAVKELSQGTLDIIKDTTLRTEKAARKKLRLLGLSEKQIAQVISRGKTAKHITLTAPMSGIVTSKNVSQGMYVKTGAPLFTIANLDHLWVNLEAYESDLAQVHLDQEVHFTVEAFPGHSFTGKVAYIDPLVSEKTRTIRVRLNVKNTKDMLKPGMFVRAVVHNKTENSVSTLLIPASAPLFTGKRALVYLQDPDQEGVYTGKEIILGQRIGAYYQVKEGLSEGDMVVTRGNFKIDSAIQIQARPSMMNPLTAHAQQDEFPSLFLSKLKLLDKSFIDLSDAVHQRDQKGVDTSLSHFETKLRQLKADDLEGEDALIWKELAMLLGSDVILTSEADSSKELDRIYATMAEHFHQVRTYFELTDTHESQAGSPELQNRLGELLAAYLTLTENLAADNLSSARTSVSALNLPAGTVLTLLKQSDHPQASQTAIMLTSALHELHQSSTLEEIRASFYSLTKAVSAAVETFGVSKSGPLYEQFCPMAFGNTGATWLAGSDVINNPYFGAMMLRCGEVRQQIKE